MDKCIHFWTIDSPNGPLSKGECQKCGEVKLFKNSIWMDKVSREYVGNILGTRRAVDKKVTVKHMTPEL